MTRAEILRLAAVRLTAAGVPQAASDARVLLRWASGLSSARFSASLHDEVGADEASRFETAVIMRAARSPVSHIVGERLFWGRSFTISPAVLDPRPETEVLIECALRDGPATRILDLGVGSGCILLTLLLEWPMATGVGIDISDRALEVAHENAHRLGVGDRVRLQRGDWLDDVEGEFDLIVANPPYLSDADMRKIAPEVRLEPAVALHGGLDGIDPYRRIVAGMHRALAAGGRILFEVGAGQAEAVSTLLNDGGIDRRKVVADLDGRGRVVCGWRD
jgi:release factor glutamine methyltransferase